MGVALGVRKPQKLAVAGAHLGERGTEERLRVRLGGTDCCGEEFFGDVFNGGGLGTAPVIAEQIGCDAKEIAARGDFAFRCQRGGEGRAEVADEAFLHQVVGECRIAGDPGKVGPQRPGGAAVKAGKGIAIHGMERQRRRLWSMAGDEAGKNGFPESRHTGFHLGRGPCGSLVFPGTEGRLAFCDGGTLGHEAETRRKHPGDSCGNDKSKTGHEGDGSEDEHGDFHVRAGVTEQEQANTEENQHDTDLQRGEDAGDGVGDGLLGLDAGGDGRGFKEALAGLRFHVLGELLSGAELVDEAAVDFALELEDAAPAAVFKELAEAPDEGAEDTDQDSGNGERLHDVSDVFAVV